MAARDTGRQAIWQLVLGCLSGLAVFLGGKPKTGPEWAAFTLAVCVLGQSSYQSISTERRTRFVHYLKVYRWRLKTFLRRLLGRSYESVEIHIYPRAAIIQHLNPTHLPEGNQHYLDRHEFNPTPDVRKAYWVDMGAMPLAFSRYMRIYINPEPWEQRSAIWRLRWDDSSQLPQPFSNTYLSAFIRQDEWTEAEVTIPHVPEGIYTVFWYFKLVDGGHYDYTNNPWAYPVQNGTAHPPSLPVGLELKAGLPGTRLHPDDARRDGVVSMEDEDDQYTINWSTLPDAATMAANDEAAHFDVRVGHPLHHDVDGPVRLHMFEYHENLPTGRFIWGGCKIVPWRGTAMTMVAGSP